MEHSMTPDDTPLGEYPDIPCLPTIADAVRQVDRLKAENARLAARLSLTLAELDIVRAERDTARLAASRQGW
jgi:hypothetical protein